MTSPARSPSATKQERITTKTYYSPPETFGVASTLIEGPTEAILVDAQFTLPEGKKVADLAKQAGKTLKAIYITHAHPDHYFGTQAVLDAFPNTPVYATPEVLAHMKELHPEKIRQWAPILGAAAPASMPPVQPLRENALMVDGQRVEIIKLPAADSPHMTVLWIPTTRTLIAADAVFDDAHVWIADADPAQRAKWLEALDQLKALKPERVIGGHAGPNKTEKPIAIDQTALYLHDFEEALKGARSKENVVKRMTEKHRDLGLPVILDAAAGAWAPK